MTIIAERLFGSSGRWAFAALASLIILGLQASGEATRQALQYDRAVILAGEWHRLLAGHWVHLDWNHALMNVAGLWLLAMINSETWSTCHSLWIYTLRGLVLSVAVGGALLLRQPELGWYVGLSGVLHGLFVIVLSRTAWRGDLFALLVLTMLLGKLLWEHYHGALTQAALGAPVIVAAHSYGALAGLLYVVAGALMATASARLSPDRTRPKARK